MKKGIKKTLSALVAFAIMVSFTPVLGASVYGAETFDKEQKVENLTKSSSTYNSVTIKWSSQAGAKGYQVYRAKSAGGKYSKVKTTTAKSFKNSGLSLKYHYYYKVRAYVTVKKKNAYGQFSDVVEASPNLKAPTLSVTAQSSSIKLSWTKVSGTTKYQLYMYDEENDNYKKLTTTGSRSYTFSKGIVKGKTYDFKVRSYRKISGKYYYSEFSDIMQGRTLPQKPTGFEASVNEEGIGLTWNAVEDAEYYEVYRSSEGSAYELIGNTAETSFEDTAVTVGKVYSYKLKACADMGGKKLSSDFVGGNARGAILAQARSWHGLNEGNKSNEPIIKVFNAKAGTKYTYTTPWCAIFVSACAIKTGNTKIIPVSAACSAYKSYKNWQKYTTSKSFWPQAGDIILYDWNNNKVADHVGMIASVNSSKGTITAIEGNTKCDGSKYDSVAYRTYKKGWSMIMSYCVPKYNQGVSVDYEGFMEEVQTEAVPDELVDLTVDAAKDEETDMEKAAAVVESVQNNDEATDGSTADALLVMEACEQMGIASSVITIVGEDGEINSYNEFVIDGQLYTVDPSEEGCVFEEQTPEKVN